MNKAQTSVSQLAEDDVSSPETDPHSSWQALLRKGLTFPL